MDTTFMNSKSDRRRLLFNLLDKKNFKRSD